ncbi:MAG: M6 family metalloprotease domain-containing protein [candidate division Zixibacteria bacterium]|nr:M6 family metalloprotease domain-containing protein [candidate division Zixibacteria bacterium]MBU1470491.1 M6 family metalloprotease domain-containing protein [candidate division Zixibacteria bacterium]MBU2626873.1 M6 family metalloprotease domain-containing protein [candidate division Zixibacteria bacterium]
MKNLIRLTCLSFVLILVLSSWTLAVMPPAPPEWYTERLGMPVPEGVKHGIPKLPPTMKKDLEEAALKRPNNTDNLLLILVEFPDNQADDVNHPQLAYDDLMFSTGVIPTGSLLEYYQEVSYGAFSPTGTVTAWIMAPHPYTYYSDGNYGMGWYPNNSQGLLEDCVNILDPTINFAQFDNNGDGYAEGIFLVHAGPGGEETGDPNDIWSHAWYHEVYTNDFVSTGRYSIEPEELLGGAMIEIGVFCHEYGHVLGLPDLYDTDGTSEGIGVYCLMAAGSWGALPGNPERPTHMCAEMKLRMGWMTPIDVTANMIGLVIPPAVTSPVCYRIHHPISPHEYFLVEDRAKIGFDSLFRGDGGLAIWHVDENGWQQDESHRYVTLEQADGSFDLEKDYGGGNRHPRTNRGDAGDLYPGATGNDYFSFSSNPNSFDYNNTTDIVTIASIEYYADSMLLDLIVDPDEPIYRLSSYDILDTVSLGAPPNFNSDADSGEVVDLVISLACDGGGAAGLSGILSTSDTRVSIIDNSADYGSASHASVVANEPSPFRFEVLTGIADFDSAATFNLHLTADGSPQDIPIRIDINRQKILLVLDNNGSNWSDNLVDAMYDAGVAFDVYRTFSDGTPEYDKLIPYQLVLWTNGSYFGTRTSDPDYEKCLTSAERTVLQQYLDNAGRVGLFSQDYIYDLGMDSFLAGYMHVTGVPQEDQGAYLIEGVPGSYMDGFSGTSMEWTFYDYSDFIIAGAGAAATLQEALDDGAIAVSYPSGDPVVGTLATTFCAYGIERLDHASLVAFLQGWYAWILSHTNIDVPLPISPKGGALVGTETPELRWTASEGAASYQVQVATEFGFTNVVYSATQPSGSSIATDPLAEGDYYWRVAATPSSAPVVTTAYSPRASFSIANVFVPGDADGSGAVDIDDVVYLIAYIFSGGPVPDPIGSGDADCSGAIDIDDVVYLIAYIFSGGPAPGDC